ncbi:MAG: stage 0 sporulation family protein [Thermodesulfobacteriota bacterium]
MGKLVRVRFRPNGKSYDFDAGAFVLAAGDTVIVETEQGLGYGCVSSEPRQVAEDPARPPLKKVFRMATEEDHAQHGKMLELEQEAYTFCEKSIAELSLPMNLFTADAAFDGSKLTFFFTAEGRVDFRELVKVLVRHFRMRIELRQIGVRHQAKMCGGLGRCGREICCSTHLSNFAPVSVKMAKVQNLSLNPTKISGLCGRLMCCLTYENDTYTALSQGYPKIGKAVETPQGKGKVARHNVMRSKVVVRLVTGTEAEFAPEEIAVEQVQASKPAAPPPEGGKKKPKKGGKRSAPQLDRNEGEPQGQRQDEAAPPDPADNERNEPSGD